MIRAILVMVVLSIGLAHATAPTYQNTGPIAEGTGVDLTVTPPGYAENDIFLLQVAIRATTESVTVSGWTSLANYSGSTSEYWLFWKRAATSEGSAIVDQSGTKADIYGMITSFRGAITVGIPFGEIGTPSSVSASVMSVAGITCATDYSGVVFPVFAMDDAAKAVTYTSTDPATYTAVSYAESKVGSDGTIGCGFGAQAVTGATGTALAALDVASGEFSGLLLSLRPPIPPPPSAARLRSMLGVGE